MKYLKVLISVSVLAIASCGGTSPSPVIEDKAPGAPSGITAVPGNQQVTISWTAPADTGITGGDGTTGVIEKYTVYWGTSDGVTPATAGSNKKDATGGTASSLVIDSLINDTTYYFIVTATNATDESAISDEASATPTDTVIPVTGVTITAGATANVVMGKTLQLTANVLPNNADQRITWSSSDDTIATVSDTGLVEPKSAGSVTITAASTADNTQEATIAVMVKEANRAPGAPTDITATAGDGEVTISWTAPADTGITGGDGTTGVIEKYTVYWGTSGGVTPATAGSNKKDATGGTASSLVIDSLINDTTYYFIVTATNATDESAISDEASATPTDTVIPVTGVTITAGATANVVMGKTLQLTANVLPNNADQRITWSSSDDTIATVSDTGLVEPKSAGSVTITATSKGKDADNNAISATIAVTVKEANRAPGAPTDITATAGDGEVTVGWTAPTDTGITGGDGTTGVIEKYTVYWGTSDGVTPATAGSNKKDATGGTTYSLVIDSLTNTTTYYFIVTATNATDESAISDEASATPMDTVIPVTGVTITAGATANVVMGKTLQLTANVLPNNADQGITWSSSDDTIATVSDTGLVEPKSAGSVTITATSKGKDADNNAISATIAVTVKVQESLNDYSLSYPVAKRNDSNISVSPIWKKGAADEAPVAGGVSYDIVPALPAGLTLDTANGTISGTVSAMLDLANVTAYQITATGNGSDYVDTATGTFLDKFVSGEYTQDTTGTAISDIDGLKAMAQTLDGEYYLTAHIDLSTEQSWTPIATSSDPFTGKLHGNGYAIYNLTIDAPTKTHQGLFASVSGAAAAIDNLSIGVTNIKGQGGIGALAGVAKTSATLSNIGVAPMTAATDPDGTKIETVSTIELAGITGGHTGGVVGHIDGATSLTGYSLVNVVGSWDLSGGLAGSVMENGTVSGYSTGTVGGRYSTGGLVGYNNGTVSGYSTGAVTGVNNSVGGLVGYNDGDVAFVSGYATGAINGVNYLGGILGNNQGKTAIGYATGTVAAATDSGGLVGKSLSTSINTGYWDKDSTGKDNRGGDASAGGTAVGITNTQSIDFASSEYTDSGNNDAVIFDNTDFTAIFDTTNGANKTWPKLKSSYTFNGIDFSFDFPQPTVSDTDGNGTIEVTY